MLPCNDEMEIGQGFSFGWGLSLRFIFSIYKKLLCFVVCCIFNEKGNKKLFKKIKIFLPKTLKHTQFLIKTLFSVVLVPPVFSCE